MSVNKASTAEETKIGMDAEEAVGRTVDTSAVGGVEVESINTAGADRSIGGHASPAIAARTSHAGLAKFKVIVIFHKCVAFGAGEAVGIGVAAGVSYTGCS